VEADVRERDSGCRQHEPLARPRLRAMAEEALALKQPDYGLDLPVFLPEDCTDADAVRRSSEALQQLLRLRAYDFWCHVVYDSSVPHLLDSLLQFLPRPHDATLPSPALRRPIQTLCNRLFAIFYRLCVAEECANGAPPWPQRSKLLRHHSVLTFSTLIDIASIFVLSNPSRTSELVQSAFSLPGLLSEAESAGKSIADNLASVHEHLAFPASRSKSGAGPDLAEAAAYFVDACKSLTAISSCSTQAACALIDGSDKYLLALAPVLHEAGNSLLGTAPSARVLPDAAAELASCLVLYAPVAQHRSDAGNCLGFVLRNDAFFRDCNRVCALQARVHSVLGERKAAELFGERIDGACSSAVGSSHGKVSVDNDKVAQAQQLLPHIDFETARACIAECEGSVENAVNMILEERAPRGGQDGDADEAGSAFISASPSATYSVDTKSSSAAAGQERSRKPLKQPSAESATGRSGADKATAQTLDWHGKQERQQSRLVAIASEYDDERDDTFDALEEEEVGGSLEPSTEAEAQAVRQKEGQASIAGDDVLGGRQGEDPAGSAKAVQKQTFYVLNGRVYNSKRRGAEEIRARSAQEASEIVKEREREEAKKIHGLKEGGNKAMFEEEAGNKEEEAGGEQDENGGRGRRGGRGRDRRPPRGRRKQADHAKSKANP